jgi:hypothetical protein
MKRTIGLLMVVGLLLVLALANVAFGTAGTAVKYTPLIPSVYNIPAAETTYAWVMSDSAKNYIKVPAGTKNLTAWLYAITLNADSLIGVIRIADQPEQFGLKIDTLSITATAGYDTREYGDSSTLWGLCKYIQLVAKTQDQHTAAAVVYNTYIGGITFYDVNGAVISRHFWKIYESFNRKDNND